MKLVIYIVLGIVILYISVVFAIKYIKPDCVRYNDYYVGWYRYPSYPGRYICALLKSNRYWHDGNYIIEGRNGYGDKIFLRNSRGVLRCDVHGERAINSINAIKDGTEVGVKFGRYLDCNNETFEDYFSYYVMEIE